MFSQLELTVKVNFMQIKNPALPRNTEAILNQLYFISSAPEFSLTLIKMELGWAGKSNGEKEKFSISRKQSMRLMNELVLNVYTHELMELFLQETGLAPSACTYILYMS